MAYREEKDSMGVVKVPLSAYYGGQTVRSHRYFPMDHTRLPRVFIQAQGWIKAAAAETHLALGLFEKEIGEALTKAALEVAEGMWDDAFIVSVYQAGAGTSQNMNANEVIANRALELLGHPKGSYDVVHPNDHVNKSQSTNDTIHTAIHIAARQRLSDLVPLLKRIVARFKKKGVTYKQVIKTAHTHLQEAVPISFGQVFDGYASVLELHLQHIEASGAQLCRINLGGTAVGTGINASDAYRKQVVKRLSYWSKQPLYAADNLVGATQNLDEVLFFSQSLHGLALFFTKLANDLRLLASGPRNGLGEIQLPPLQPGSSIMPGKVNPALPEMINMVCFQVMGLHHAIQQAVQAAQLELNVMMPLIAYNILHMEELLIQSLASFEKNCLQGLTLRKKRLHYFLEMNPIVGTILNTRFGYQQVAKWVQAAYMEEISLESYLVKHAILSASEAKKILYPKHLI